MPYHFVRITFLPTVRLVNSPLAGGAEDFTFHVVDPAAFAGGAVELLEAGHPNQLAVSGAEGSC